GNCAATQDEAAHARIPLSEGEVDGCTVECWLHGSRFDLRTGQPTGLPAVRPVPTYPVKIDGDDVYVAIQESLLWRRSRSRTCTSASTAGTARARSSRASTSPSSRA